MNVYSPNMVIIGFDPSPHQEMDQEMDQPAPPKSITQAAIYHRSAPHGVSHPVQEHRPCSDHPNQENESLGRHHVIQDDLGSKAPGDRRCLIIVSIIHPFLRLLKNLTQAQIATLLTRPIFKQGFACWSWGPIIVMTPCQCLFATPYHCRTLISGVLHVPSWSSWWPLDPRLKMPDSHSNQNFWTEKTSVNHLPRTTIAPTFFQVTERMMQDNMMLNKCSCIPLVNTLVPAAAHKGRVTWTAKNVGQRWSTSSYNLVTWRLI